MGSSRSKSRLTSRILTFGLSVGLLAGTAALAPPAAYAATNPSGTEVLSTIEPATKCAADDIIGREGITLNAQNTAPVGSSMTTTFDLAVAGTTTNLLGASDQEPSTTGTAARYMVSQSLLQAASTGDFTEFTWSVSAIVGTQKPIASKTCSFTVDYTTPGVPVVTGASTSTTGVDCVQAPGPVTTPMGSECSFTITPTTTGGDLVPAGYGYLLNSTVEGTVTAAKPGAGNSFDPTTGAATLTVPLASNVSNLVVWALSPGGNIGPSATVSFGGAFPQNPTGTADITGDGLSDLIFAGGTGNVPAGLWYAAGKANGTVHASTVNIGETGLGGNGSADWTGTQAISGPFCGDNVQDVLAYNPANGGYSVACNDGSANAQTAINPAGGQPVGAGAVGSLNDGNVNATQVVGAGNTASTNGGSGPGYGTDLLATLDNQLYLFTSFEPAGYLYIPGFTSDDLSGTPSPDGTYDWDSWTLATTQINGATDLYLWNPTTGALDSWTGLSAGTSDPSAADGPYPNALTLSAANKYVLYDGVTTHWNQGATLDLQSGDVNGAPVLWTVDTTTDVAQTFLPNATDTALRTVATQTLSFSTHS